MNELDFIVAVFVSSGAGYLAGKHYERKKATKAFRKFHDHVVKAVEATSSGLMEVLRKYASNVDMKILMQEVVDACAKKGAQIMAYDPESGHVVKSDDNQAK